MKTLGARLRLVVLFGGVAIAWMSANASGDASHHASHHAAHHAGGQDGENASSLNAAGELAEQGNVIPLNNKSLYSQYNEESIIRHFFQDRRGGVFLDVGSWHWKLKSTTLYLEKHLGWSGIAIDALPEMEAGYRAYRPATKFYNRIATDHSGTMGKIFRAGELTSTDESHIDGFPGAEERVKEIYGEFGSIEVRTATLDEILDENGIRKVDFLSMDIEAGEPAALAGFDIDRFRPDLICIEATQSIRKQIAAYFKSHGYERIEAYLAHDFVNWYYRPVSESAAR